MKEKKSKRVIVRITENQFKNLMDLVISESKDRSTVSDVIREAVIDKLNQLKKDDKRKK
jgi:Arc/MetJ-type ribon-helix-helix transcriptional regulator